MDAGCASCVFRRFWAVSTNDWRCTERDSSQRHLHAGRLLAPSTKRCWMPKPSASNTTGSNKFDINDEEGLEPASQRQSTHRRCLCVCLRPYRHQLGNVHFQDRLMVQRQGARWCNFGILRRHPEDYQIPPPRWDLRFCGLTAPCSIWVRIHARFLPDRRQSTHRATRRSITRTRGLGPPAPISRVGTTRRRSCGPRTQRQGSQFFASPGFGAAPAAFFEWDGRKLNPVPGTPNTPTDTSYFGNMLVLPDPGKSCSRISRTT